MTQTAGSADFLRSELADLPPGDYPRADRTRCRKSLASSPAVFLALARRPDEFRAFFAYHDTLMEKPGGLTKAEREMIVVATSGVNNCYLLRRRPRRDPAHQRSKNLLVADQVAVNYRKADLAPRQKAMLDFAVKVAERSHMIDDTDYEELNSHRRFSDDDAWDIAATIAAMFAMSNRLANAFSIKPNLTNSMGWGAKVGAERQTHVGTTRGPEHKGGHERFRP